jgi:hypothetical protein
MGGTHGKGGHQLVDFTLTERAFYPGGGGCHQKIEFVVAVFTVIFVNWHDCPPIFNKKWFQTI